MKASQLFGKGIHCPTDGEYAVHFWYEKPKGQKHHEASITTDRGSTSELAEVLGEYSSSLARGLEPGESFEYHGDTSWAKNIRILVHRIS